MNFHTQIWACGLYGKKHMLFAAKNSQVTERYGYYYE